MNDNAKGTGTVVKGGGDTSGTGTSVKGTPSGTGTAVKGAPSGTGTSVKGSAGSGTAEKSSQGDNVSQSSEIPVLEEYIINGVLYKQCKDESKKTLSKISGEARILVVENAGNRFCLKIFKYGLYPDHEILERVKKAQGGFLVPIREHGKWTAPDGKQFDYVLMDYLPYGSLADTKIVDEEKLKFVAMRMAFALKQCHKDLKFIHRDLKPENFMYTDASRKEFVLIDFGIARKLDAGKPNEPIKVDASKSSYYVSPEGAISSTDTYTYVNIATDYYSMGMSLLAMVLGVDKFYSIYPYNKLPELDRLKRNNSVVKKLSGQLNLSDYASSLLERLLEFSDNNRAGFDDVVEWYKGKTLKTGSQAEAEMSKDSFRVVFNEEKGKIATTPAELAKMMIEDMEFAKKFLYRGVAMNVLQAQRPTLALEIDDVVNRKYPRPEQQTAGLFAVARLLDPQLPLYSDDGKRVLRTENDIANEIYRTWISNSKVLTDPNHQLWIFLRSKGGEWKKIADTYPKLLVNSDNRWVWNLYYLIGNDRKSFSVQYLDDKKWYKVYSMKEMAAAASEHGLTDLTYECLAREHFVTWLLCNEDKDDTPRAAVLEKLVKEAGSNAKNRGWYLFYTIMPDVSITGKMKKSDVGYIYTAQDLGRELNREITLNLTWFKKTSAGSLMSMLSSVQTFQNSQLKQYMEARKMQSYIDGITKILDINANINAHPAAPYNSMIARWKIVQYLGQEPFFHFEKSKVDVKDLSQMSKASSQERNELINQGWLPAFLTLFFHENIKSQFSVELLKQYSDYLHKNYPNYTGVIDCKNQERNLKDAIDRRNKEWQGLKITRWLVGLLCVLPMLITLGGILYLSFNDTGGVLPTAFMGIGNVAAIIMAIVGVLVATDGGLIGMAIGGVLGYWITYAIFKFLSAFAPYIVVGILLICVILCLRKFLKYSKDTHIPNRSAYNNLLKDLDLIRVCRTLGTINRVGNIGNESDTKALFNRSADLAQKQKKNVRKAAIYMVILTVVTVGIGVAINYGYEHVDEFATMNDNIPSMSQITCDYNGTFHERKTTMTLSESSGSTVRGTIVINYSTPMTFNVSGDYNEATGELVLYSLKTNGNRDKYVKFDGVMTGEDTPNYKGTYTNGRKGSTHTFDLTKE